MKRDKFTSISPLRVLILSVVRSCPDLFLRPNKVYKSICLLSIFNANFKILIINRSQINEDIPKVEVQVNLLKIYNLASGCYQVLTNRYRLVCNTSRASTCSYIHHNETIDWLKYAHIYKGYLDIHMTWERGCYWL